MQFVWMIVIGLIGAAIAWYGMPGTHELGTIRAALVAIGGAIVGGLLCGVLFKSQEGKFNLLGWVMSLAGALLLLWLAPRFL